MEVSTTLLILFKTPKGVFLFLNTVTEGWWNVVWHPSYKNHQELPIKIYSVTEDILGLKFSLGFRK
jgi:hypothetical protein